MKILNYINPKLVIKSLVASIKDLAYFKKYKSILNELERDNKLKKIGFTKVDDKLFIGVNLNPELLMYTDDSQESVELKFVSDAMRKYTDFLQNEGILDSISADYERVYNDTFYGYIVQIRYKFKNYDKSKMIYDISYLSILLLTSLIGAFVILTNFI